MTRREQRTTVFDQLYFYGFYGEDSFEKQCDLYLETEVSNPSERAGLKAKAFNIISLIPEIDGLINKAAIGWKTDRMTRVDLAILRLAVYEAFYDESVPESVAINEAIELSKIYSGPEAASFVNGILGKLSREKETKNGKDDI
ncbi:MAG: transcription antitermination factor NusB [Lachnospiraceae bacterium]|nr:transcription antitermination factor NusB [Lachnospiraceae bacterium]